MLCLSNQIEENTAFVGDYFVQQMNPQVVL